LGRGRVSDFGILSLAKENQVSDVVNDRNRFDFNTELHVASGHESTQNFHVKVCQSNFECWRKAEIGLNQLASWVVKDLWKGWGFKAAARTFHIARCGSDADIVGRYRGYAAD
jgi:hypothetical protein